jgi:uncharacterized protein (TIGR00255 family)
MLLSMTGFGEAHGHLDGLAVAIEIRTVNNRHFKYSYRSSDGFASLETDVERLLRQAVRRGTTQVNLRVVRESSGDDYRINTTVLDGYCQQLTAFRAQGQVPGHHEINIESMLQLPGVVEENSGSTTDPHEHWHAIEPILQQAVDALCEMRREEGQALAIDLLAQCDVVAENVDLIDVRAPLVADDYRARLIERVDKVMKDYEVTVQPTDLIREVSLFVDRSDISEEIVRLRSHLEQFRAAVGLDESAGRKLEFIAQEMGREINTIGSKANDTEISRHVVESKAALERIREQVQNVE